MAVIALPTVRMNNAVRTDPAECLLRGFGFSAIRSDFGVNLATSLEDTRYWCSFVCSATSLFSFDMFATKARFVDFNFAFKWRLGFTIFCNACPDQGRYRLTVFQCRSVKEAIDWDLRSLTNKLFNCLSFTSVIVAPSLYLFCIAVAGIERKMVILS